MKAVNQELEDIELLRKSMYDLAEKYGLTHPKVVRVSQKLDLAHNKFIQQRVCTSNNKNDN
ncbi:Spo0E like sporulation regulatory protein [Peribacillus simplex]|uniref:Spo0E like sporulation regulatory protein n=1 Tax=Peribacillus simplex TaxID=1478 RepID=A0A9X8RDV7_9BACI|nr:aspartyl-phosphate phosphatase Spo0E family protein [Peribacillus simplex]SIS03800.1 Spo0E like sporulation regulatory protein [Peribacillus simplex]